MSQTLSSAVSYTTLLWAPALTIFKYSPGSWIAGSQQSSARATTFLHHFPRLPWVPAAEAAYWPPDPSRQVSVLAVAPAWWPHPLGSDIFIFPLSLQLCPAVGCPWLASLSPVLLLSNSIAWETNSLHRNPALDTQVQLSSLSVGHCLARRDLCSDLKAGWTLSWPSFCFPLIMKWRGKITRQASAEGHTVTFMCGIFSFFFFFTPVSSSKTSKTNKQAFFISKELLKWEK